MTINRRWKVPAVALSLMLAALETASTAHSAPRAAPATVPACFTYILDGNIWLRCGGRTHRLTHEGDITDFAISANTIALEHAQGDIHSFRLNGGVGPYLDPRGGPSRLYASCGTILHVRYGYNERGFPTGRAAAVLEVPGAKPLHIGRYSDFRCSSDRGVVLGLTVGGPTLILRSPSNNSETIPSGGHPYYAVSANGQFIAYGGEGKVCVQRMGGRFLCVSDEIFDRVSISDDGSALYTTHWDEHTCSYKDAWHASLRPRAGYTEGDLCQAVGMWRPGLTKPEILEPLARDPQWVSIDTAVRLKDLSLWQKPADSDRPTGALH